MEKFMDYEKEYSEKSFFDKVANYAKTAGATVIYLALLLYYAALKPEVPLKVKGTVFGALGYFVFPIDAIPDFIPAAGYTDDLGVIVFAIAICSMYIDDSVKEKAKAKMISLFGEEIVKDIDQIASKHLNNK